MCSAAEDPVALVDPFIGTGGLATFGGNNEGQTADFPGAAAPFGMIDWSPDTPTQPTSSGYWYHDAAITGFSLTHVSGAGCSIFGDFDILPAVGAVADPSHAQQPFSHIGEVATPGYYAVALGRQPIHVELAATPRSGLGAFTFPASAQANVLVKVSSDQAGVSNSEFRVVGPNEIAGYASSGGFCGMPNTFTVYLDAQFDRPFVAHGTWAGEKITAASDSANGTDAGGYLTFDTTRDATVKMKVAISYVSVAGARANLSADAKTWDVATVRAGTAATWRSLLGEVSVSGNVLPERRMFYTALYHTFLDPNLFSDADGSYRGFDGIVHRDPPGHAEYANFSGWDTYRSTMALQALLAPKPASDMIESLVHAAEQGGWLPKWPVANGYSGVMGGDAADPLIASAYAFGARNFDRKAALAAMLKGATDANSPPGQGWYLERPDLDEYLRQGYVTNGHTNSVSNEPNGASETLEYALDDFAIARFALATGEKATYARFMRRAANWTNVFNSQTGLVAPRGRNGAFERQPLTPNGQSGFQEGDAWQYTWMVPQSYGALVRALGGRAAAVAKLDAYLSSLNEGQSLPFAWMGNQPSFGDDWVYLWAGAPYRQQLVTRQLLTALYSPSPDGIPGNDDLGSMSAMWAWEAMGLYPVNVAVRELELGAPLFTHVSLRAPDGPRIEISAPQAADGVPYVASLKVNGRATQRVWMPLPESGTLRLDYALSATPDVAWGSSPQDAPPTYVSVAESSFPRGTAAGLELTQVTLSLVPGQSATLPLRLSNREGTAPVNVARYDVNASGGISLAIRGPGEVAAYGESNGTLIVTAAQNMNAGLYDVAVGGVTQDGAPLQPVYAAVRITVPGQRAALDYVADYNGNAVTPVDPRTNAFGSSIVVDQNPVDVALSSDGSRAYTANEGSNDVSAIDTATLSVVKTVPVGTAPTGIACSPDGATIWVTNNGDNTVQAIDAKTLAASPAIAVGSHPGALVVSPDGATVYVVDRNSGDVAAIDARARTVKARVPAGDRPFGIGSSPDGKTLYVTNFNAGTLSVIDLARSSIVATVPAGKRPRSVAVSPEGSTVYVVSSASGTVTPVDAKTYRAGPAIRVGGAPHDIAFEAGGKTLLVALSGDDALVRIDAASARVVERIDAGNYPIALGLPR